MTATAEHAPAEVVEAKPIQVAGDLNIEAIHGAVLTHQQAADFGAYFTISLTGTEAPIPLLPYDVNRSKAYVTCTGTGPVYIGSVAGTTAMRNGQTTGQASAYILPTGITMTISHKQAVYLAPDGTHTATVSVAVERWES